mgnify:CR=1 FL=1
MENFDNIIKIINAGLFIFLGLIWSNKTWINVIVKFIMIIVAIANIYVILNI